ncbi:hypothetical protein [Curtobacterium sp. B8]|uniref:hypothetical protein n=1 Tax=Curtobacterium sp. B8 TaxID=95611 RepID=UPI0011D23A47|nr:hypothetical protein [Curtobacterium sp. B8]
MRDERHGDRGHAADGPEDLVRPCAVALVQPEHDDRGRVAFAGHRHDRGGEVLRGESDVGLRAHCQSDADGGARDRGDVGGVVDPQQVEGAGRDRARGRGLDVVGQGDAFAPGEPDPVTEGERGGGVERVREQRSPGLEEDGASERRASGGDVGDEAASCGHVRASGVRSLIGCWSGPAPPSSQTGM